MEAPQPLDSPVNPPLPQVTPVLSKKGDISLSDLGRWVYTNNPFYAISASLVFWGLRSSFDTQGHHFHAFALMGGLVAYTLLLSLAAYVVIRFGKVWDDGRSLLVLIVLMFLAISVSFDDALAVHPRNGTICYLAGLVLSVLLTEGLLHGISLRLPALFRVPYYLLLGLFFLYPVALYWGVSDPFGPAVPWALAAFSPLAGLIYLLLLFAARRGSDYVRDNGSPWSWPWYPWTLFFIMGLGVCGRSFYLCVSMHQAGGTATIFAPYFLVPFLLAASIVLLEIAIVSRSTAALRLAVIAPAGLLLLAAIPPSGKLGFRFLHETFIGTVGVSPLLVTAWALAVFYGVAALRRVPCAAAAFSAVLVILAFIGPQTVDTETLAGPQSVPILVLALVQGWLALRWHGSWRYLVAACCAVAAATAHFRETGFMVYRGVIPIHLLLAAVLLIGAVFRDRFARILQHAGAALLLLAAVASLTGDMKLLGDVPPIWLSLYPALAILTAAAYGWLVGNWSYFAAGAAAAACWIGIAGTHGYRQLRHTMAGLDYILWGFASLLLALLISLTKTGLARRWFARRSEKQDCSAREQGRSMP